MPHSSFIILHSSFRRKTGFTLLEVILALVIITLLSTAVTALITGAANASRYVTTTGDAVWQLDNAARRMTYNLSMASVLDSPTNTTLTNTFTIHTQPDAGNSNTTYQVSYALSGTNLQETDPRYGTNTIAQNVTTFSVTRVTTTAPSTLTLTITAGDVTRTFTVMCRNL